MMERNPGESLKDFVARGGSYPAGPPAQTDEWEDEGDLNGAESRVLDVLMEAEGRLLTPDEIEAAVFGGQPTGKWGSVPSILMELQAKRPDLVGYEIPYGWRFLDV